MQKCSDPSGFFAKSTGATHGDEDSQIALSSSNSSSYFLLVITLKGYAYTWTSLPA